MTFASPSRLEHQSKVRGWLLASLDGQTTGLVPANYVKVLGKRRGLKHAEMERLAQEQQVNAIPTQGVPQGLGSASAAASMDGLLESAYRETPVPFRPATSNSSLASSTVLNIPEKTDL